MPEALRTVLAVAGAAAAASVAGGLIALWRRPTPYFMSVTLGFASGVLLGTVTFEMLPQALEHGGLVVTAAGFAAGFAALYALDLFVHHGQLAGERSERRPQVERFYQRRRPRGSEVTVLAGGTSIEELVEGLSIGAGAAIKPGLAVLVALAIAIDNLIESLSIGELIRSREDTAEGKPGGQGLPDRQKEGDRRAAAGHQAWRVMGWTSLIGAAVFSSALVGWATLRGAPEPLLAFLFALGGGGMLYLTVTDLLPEAQERQYQQSSTLATGAGMLMVLILAQFL